MKLWKWGQCYQYRKFPARHWLVEQAVTSQLCLTMELLRTYSQSAFPLPEDPGGHQIEGTNCGNVQLYRKHGLSKRSSVSCVCPMCQAVHTYSRDWEGCFYYASQTSVLLLISPMKLRFLSSQQYVCTEALVYNVSSATPNALPQTIFCEGWSWLEGLLAEEASGTRNPRISEPTLKNSARRAAASFTLHCHWLALSVTGHPWNAPRHTELSRFAFTASYILYPFRRINNRTMN